MGSVKFDEAVEKTLSHEGGYVNNPKDRGGETNFGISKRSYPNVDIRDLTKEDAIAIYKRDFWDPNGYEGIENDDVAAKLFDMAVLMGAKKANKIMQETLQDLGIPVKADGISGPITIEGINQIAPEKLLTTFKVRLRLYFTALAKKQVDQQVFFNGWINRMYS